LAEWLAEGEAAPAGARHLLSLAEDARPPAALAAGGDALCLLSGPEGGLDALEEALARQHGFTPLSLGPRVLRADTAPLAALAWLGLAKA
jgi:16S rRNA (uracil1498-N3)-methyltransferase